MGRRSPNPHGFQWSDIVNSAEETFMEIYMHQKSTQEVNEQFEKKMNQDVNGNMKLL